MNKLFGAKKKEAPKAPVPTLQETSAKVTLSFFIGGNHCACRWEIEERLYK